MFPWPICALKMEVDMKNKNKLWGLKIKKIVVFQAIKDFKEY